MERIIEHIERLLLQHDCVIIPDFGGFVLQSVPADYLEESHLFTPARKEIVFNPTLTHNDGLLSESYMQTYAIDFTKAQSLIRNDVVEMKSQLDDNAGLQLGAIGLFFKEDNRLIFMPAKRSDELFSIQSYGLPYFNCLPLTARNTLEMIPTGPDSKSETNVTTEHQSIKEKNVIYNIPVTRTFLQVVCAIAAAILLFLIMPTPVNDVNKASYTASFVPPEIMPKKSADEMVTGAFSMYENEMNAKASSDSVDESASSSSEWVVHADVSNATVSDSTKSNTRASSSGATAVKAKPSPGASSASPPAASSTKSSSASKGGTNYYVIIASYDTKTRAQTYMKGLNESVAAHAGIIVRDGHVRVYAQVFASLQEAEAFRNTLRKNPKHAQAWICK